MNKVLFSLLYLVCFLQPIFGNEFSADSLSADGPYILYQTEAPTQVITVTSQGVIERNTYDSLPTGFRFEVVSHDGKHHFSVALHPVERPQWKCPQPEKLFVMSDPHGDMDCFVSLLQGNGIIDNSYRWTYGKNQLVILGDVFDRGYDVLPVFWLIYKLEQEAAEAGGRVDFLLGNHETMVLMNDMRYAKPKYRQLADSLQMAYPELWGRSSELGYWLCTRNTLMLVGRNLLVHAGLSLQLYEKRLSIPTINEQMSYGLYKNKAARKADSRLTYFLFGSYGPIWYRGLVKQTEKYHPLPTDSIAPILQYYEADRIIVGHTIMEDISTFYQHRVIAVNVDNQANRNTNRGRAILIEKGIVYVVADKGTKRELF